MALHIAVEAGSSVCPEPPKGSSPNRPPPKTQRRPQSIQTLNLQFTIDKRPDLYMIVRVISNKFATTQRP